MLTMLAHDVFIEGSWLVLILTGATLCVRYRMTILSSCMGQAKQKKQKENNNNKKVKQLVK